MKKQTLNRAQMWLVYVLSRVARWVPWRVTTYSLEWTPGLLEEDKPPFTTTPHTRWEWRNDLVFWGWLGKLNWTHRWINTIDPWEDDPLEDEEEESVEGLSSSRNYPHPES